MSSAPPLPDIESLLAPVFDDAPCGGSLRYEGTYDRVREARREDDASLPMGEWESRLKVADWALVERLCVEALQKKSKDLQVAAWLVEALLRRRRIRGLAHGFLLLEGLCARYWDGLFPSLGEDNDPAARLALFEWLDDVTSSRLRGTAFQDGEGSAGYTLLDWELSGKPPPRRDDGQDDGGAPPPRPSRAALLARISLSGTSPWTALAVDAEAALVAVDKLEDVLAARLAEAPSFRRIKDVLGMIQGLARDGVRASGEEMQTRPGVAQQGDVDWSVSRPPIGAFNGPSGAIASRADAYYRLAEAAEYLMRTEPHSPVPYLVKRAVQWGNLSLAELLYEFIGNPDDLVAIQQLLGMRGKE